MLFALSTKLSSIIGCKDTYFILNVWHWILFLFIADAILLVFSTEGVLFILILNVV